MEVLSNFGNSLVILGVVLSVFVEATTRDLKELSLGDTKLCSDLTKRKVKYESLIVNEGQQAVLHPIPWLVPNICGFEVQSVYRNGGIMAVIQKLHLRRNFTSGDCIDYIQFRSKKGASSQRHCGFMDAKINMNYDLENAPDSVFPAFFPISYSNSFIDLDGELDVVIYIAKPSLEPHEKTELKIVFTSFQNCSKFYPGKYNNFRECDDRPSLRICINKKYFGDGYINCPYFGCVDEGGCISPKVENKSSVGNRVIIGSVSTLGLLFAVFIAIICIFKKHKLFCWAEDFAHPSPTPENNRNSRVIEMNEQTGARLADTQTNSAAPSAPISDEDKDLPPSYDSLFPDSPNPR